MHGNNSTLAALAVDVNLVASLGTGKLKSPSQQKHDNFLGCV